MQEAPETHFPVSDQLCPLHFSHSFFWAEVMPAMERRNKTGDHILLNIDIINTSDISEQISLMPYRRRPLRLYSIYYIRKSNMEKISPLPSPSRIFPPFPYEVRLGSIGHNSTYAAPVQIRQRAQRRNSSSRVTQSYP